MQPVPRPGTVAIRQEAPDEFFRRDGLGLVAGVSQCFKVMVFRDNVTGGGCDGAIGENVVVRVRGDEAEARTGAARYFARGWNLR